MRWVSPDTVARMRQEGQPAIPNAETLLRSGASTWYRDDPAGGKQVFDPKRGEYVSILQPPGIATVADFRKSHGIVKGNSGASLVDLGDGIAAIQLHSKKDAVGEDITRLVTQTLNPGSDAVRDFQGFVITGDGANFSVGANLFQVLLFIQEGEWEDLDFAVRAFQRMTAAIRFCPRPVVVAPVRPLPGRRSGDRAARRQPPAPRRALHGPGGNRCRRRPWRWWHQGNGSARGRFRRRHPFRNRPRRSGSPGRFDRIFRRPQAQL